MSICLNPGTLQAPIHLDGDGGMRVAIEPDLAGERKAQFGICCENVDICCHLWNLLFCVGLYCRLQRFAAI